jgi:hypothetical protein
VTPPGQEVDGMPSPNWTDDDKLLRDLRRALRPTAVDDRVIHAARAAFIWRNVDTDLELARMFYDSYLDEAVLVRGPLPGAPRTLVFRGEDLGVEIEFSEAGIEGQLVPPVPGTVTLMTPGGAHSTVTADDIGCFAFPGKLRGPLRLQCTVDGASFATEWITA